MIDRGAHERQPKRDVHAAAEGRVLQDRQALVVIHGEHRIGVFQPLGHKQRIGRYRAARFDARRAGGADRRRDHIGVLMAEVARLTAMGIEAGDQDARAGDAKAPAQVGVEHAQRPAQ